VASRELAYLRDKVARLCCMSGMGLKYCWSPRRLRVYYAA